MTYYGGKELAAAFRTVRENTIKIAEEIPEDKYDFKPAPDTPDHRPDAGAHRARARLPAPTSTSNKITDLKTVNFPELMQGVEAEEAKPRTKAEIIALPEDPKAKSSRRSSKACPKRSSPSRWRCRPARSRATQEPLRDAARRQGARDASPRRS